jgi:hypothetical protein
MSMRYTTSSLYQTTSRYVGSHTHWLNLLVQENKRTEEIAKTKR